MDTEEFITTHSLNIRWNISAGSVFSTYLSILREGKIAGMRCSKCGVVYFPPRQVCGDCFSPLSEWVELGNEGIVEAFIITYHSIPDPVTGEKRKTPAAIALIKLDGASTPIQGWILEDDFSKLHIGTRVQAVWREPRKLMSDLLGFKYSDSQPNLTLPRPIKSLPRVEDISVDVSIPISFRYDAGKGGEWFFNGLKKGIILASRCDTCGKVMVPSRSFCPNCFKPLFEKNLLEVGPYGTVKACTSERKDGFRISLIRLDGADNDLLHRTTSTTGRRVRARFRTPDSSIPPLLWLDYFEETQQNGD